MPNLTKRDKKNKITQTEAERRRAVAIAKLRELELKEKQGRLIDRTQVERTWFEHARLIRDGILSIPDRLSALMASISDPHKVHQLLDSELRKALSEVADSIMVN